MSVNSNPTASQLNMKNFLSKKCSLCTTVRGVSEALEHLEWTMSVGWVYGVYMKELEHLYCTVL
jgi:hypothetical protein